MHIMVYYPCFIGLILLVYVNRRKDGHRGAARSIPAWQIAWLLARQSYSFYLEIHSVRKSPGRRSRLEHGEDQQAEKDGGKKGPASPKQLDYLEIQQ